MPPARGAPAGIALLPLTTWAPEDVVLHVLSFLDGRALAAASCASRELYFGAARAARLRFERAFGGRPDPSLPRLRLFHLVDRTRGLLPPPPPPRPRPARSTRPAPAPPARASVPCVFAAADEANLRDLMLWSAMRGYVTMLRSLLRVSCAAPVASSLRDLAESQQPGTGATPLLLACEHNQEAAARLLLEDVNDDDDIAEGSGGGVDCLRVAANGLAAVHVCARLGHLKLLRLLLARDARQARLTVQPDGRTPLHFAAQGGHVAACELLLAAGAEPDAATTVHDDTGGETALHLASYAGNLELVALLLAGGASPNLQMRNGRTPLLLACEIGWTDVALLLLTRSFLTPVDLALATDSGKSALYCAVEKGFEDLVGPLLAAGGNASQATRRNKIPLYVAAEKGFVGIARLLLDHADATGADAFVRTTYGTTPLFIAAKTTNKAMKDLLANYVGANGSPRRHRRGRSSNPGVRLSRDAAATAAEDGSGGGGSGALFAEELPIAARRSMGIATRDDQAASVALAAFVMSAGGAGAGAGSLSPGGGIGAGGVARRGGGRGVPGGPPPQPAALMPLFLPLAGRAQQQAAAVQGLGGGLGVGGGGNTLGEIMIRERARREAEEAEQQQRHAELFERHRRQAAELAVSARRRLEDKAAGEATARADAEAEARAQRERDERRRRDKDRQLQADFARRLAEREARERATMESLALPLPPASPPAQSPSSVSGSSRSSGASASSPTSAAASAENSRGLGLGGGAGISAATAAAIAELTASASSAAAAAIASSASAPAAASATVLPSPRQLASPYAAKLMRTGARRRPAAAQQLLPRPSAAAVAAAESTEGDSGGDSFSEGGAGSGSEAPMPAALTFPLRPGRHKADTASEMRTRDKAPAPPALSLLGRLSEAGLSSRVAPGGNVIVARAPPKAADKGPQVVLKTTTFGFGSL